MSGPERIRVEPVILQATITRPRLPTATGGNNDAGKRGERASLATPGLVVFPLADRLIGALSEPTICAKAPPLLSAQATAGWSPSTRAMAGWTARPVPLVNCTAESNEAPPLLL